MAGLSVIVITKNEAHHMEACLRSVAFADQIVVLDSGSSDATLALAQALGAQTAINTDWQGFGVQKNRALALATGEWVLSIDADECVPPGLAEEIRQALQAPGFDAYSFPRRSSFCGQYMRYSGWYPDRVTRLFRRQTARFSDDLVHERLLCDTPVGKLNTALLHESYRDLEAVLDKANRYSTAGALLMQRRGKTASPGTAFAHGLWAFLRTYVLRLGFLDGRLGLVLAISVAEATYYRYLKLWQLGK